VKRVVSGLSFCQSQVKAVTARGGGGGQFGARRNNSKSVYDASRRGDKIQARKNTDRINKRQISEKTNKEKEL
jgi:hypothetical protein